MSLIDQAKEQMAKTVENTKETSLVFVPVAPIRLC